ncbi:MAG: hypothetical protein KME23_10585 [Goleter apudmare HA4340-LM2]|nr:hypothetical protein [Goleter apudmare HA4340-LM2]
MTQMSNIRKLLTDSKLGLLPHLDERLQEIEKLFQQQQENLQFPPYELQFGNCNTLAANEPRPLITQSVSLQLFMTGSAKDKLELLLLASELQNAVDAAIFEWSNREWYQFEKPLKRPVTQIVGGLDGELLDNAAKSYRITIYREFDLIYTLSF